MKSRLRTIFAIAMVCSALLASGAASRAQSAARPAAPSPVKTPKAAPATPPSLLMEGTGQITQGGPCASGGCPGSFTASLSGRPFGKSTLTLSLLANPAADSFAPCNQLTASGSLNGESYTANFVGQVCEPAGGVGYMLTGTLEIFARGAAIGTSAIGTMVAFGGTNIPPNPIPNSATSLVSIVGASGKIPLLIP